MTEALSKVCKTCHELKSLDQFGIDAHTKDGHATRCFECKRAESARYRAKHPEKVVAASRAWERTHPEAYQAGVDKRREGKNTRRRQRYIERKAKENTQNNAWYERNKTSRKLTMKAWDLANPGYPSRKSARRRARKRALPDTWTAEQQAFMHSYWQHTCAACGNQEGLWWTLASDHFVPLASPQCPGTIATNMLPLCDGQGGCNTSKGDTDAHAWLLRRFGPKKAAKIEKAIATYFTIVAARFGEAVAS